MLLCFLYLITDLPLRSVSSFTSTSWMSTPLPLTISPGIILFITISSPFTQSLAIFTIGPRISTLTVTTVWTSTYFGGQVTTYSTVVETGILSTDSPKPNGFVVAPLYKIITKLTPPLGLHVIQEALLLSPYRQRCSSSFWLSSYSSRAEDTNSDKALVGQPKTSSPPLTRYGGPRSGTTTTRMTTPSLLSLRIPTSLHPLKIGIAGRGAIGALGQWEEVLRVLHPTFPCSEVRRLEGSRTCLVLARPFRLW